MEETIRVYTVLDVCKMLTVSRRTVYRYIKSGQLETTKVGQKHIILADSLNRLLYVGTKAGVAK